VRGKPRMACFLKKVIYSIILQFSFLPQVIAAVLIYTKLKIESAVLIDGVLQKGLLIVFAEIAVFAILSVPRRFYFTKFLLFSAYAQLITVVLARRFSRGYTISVGFAVCGMVLVLINVLILRFFKKTERNNGNG
jgi:hypothetical protein